MRINKFNQLIILFIIVYSCNNKAANTSNCIQLNCTVINVEIISGNVNWNYSIKDVENIYPDLIKFVDDEYKNKSRSNNLTKLLVKKCDSLMSSDIRHNFEYYFIDEKLTKIVSEFYFSVPDSNLINNYLQNKNLDFLRKCTEFNQCYLITTESQKLNCWRNRIILDNNSETIGFVIESFPLK